MAVGNNGTRLVGNTEFYGGLSTDNKIGIENSFADGECLDVRKSPSQMTVLPMARELPDSGTITGLMTAMTQTKDGTIYGVDEAGKLYSIDENNAVSSCNIEGYANVSINSQIVQNVYAEQSLTASAIWNTTVTLTYDSSDYSWKSTTPSISATPPVLFNKYGIYYDTYTGKNAIQILPKNGGDHGVSATYNSGTGVVTLSGTNDATWSNCFNRQSIVLKAGTYTFTSVAPSGMSVHLLLRRDGETIMNTYGRTSRSFTLKEDVDELLLWLDFPQTGIDRTGAQFTVQLEKGSEATDFEKFAGAYPQNGDTITVNTRWGGFSSGYGLEYFAIDNGIWYTDGNHSLFSFGPALSTVEIIARSMNFWSYLQDQSEYIVDAIEIQRDGDAEYYQSNPDIERSKGTSTCAVPTSVSETNTNKILFLPALMPVVRIGIRFMAKGSGSVRIEIHDVNNNVVASSKEILASGVSTTGYTYFVVRPDIHLPESAINQLSVVPWSGDTIESGDILHIHVIASSSGYTIKTSTANDMYLDADFTSEAYILHETFNKKHPMVVRDNLYIGNGRYVSVKKSSPLNQLTDNLFIQNGLRLDDGFEVCSFASSDEYLIIGAEKYSAGSKRGFQAGRIYFWDTRTEGPNFYIDCTMGSPKTMFNFGNIVYVIIAGALYAYTGGKELVKVRTLKGTDTEYSDRSSVTEVNPNMMAVRREILVMGFPSHTTAYTIRHGIYAFGSVDKNFPNCFTYNYKIPGPSAATTLSQYNSDNQELRIGCVYNFNDSLFYSYEVKTTTETPGEAPVTTTDVGLALVDNDSGTSTSFLWKSLQYDAGCPASEKQGCRIGIYFDPLPENTTITPIYRIDDGEWVTGKNRDNTDITATEGERYITCEVNKRFHEIQYGFTGTSGNDLLTPVIKQVSIEIRVLNEEAKL
ncbi:MAG: hypothetical protein IIZ78_00585 [Clostridiales bacterium]|nr:hypothetical protein [Clostridiales bacterium]